MRSLFRVLGVALLLSSTVFPLFAQDESVTYIVQRGDTLFRIALRYGIEMESLAQANQITNASRILVGQTLVIPGLMPPTAEESAFSAHPYFSKKIAKAIVAYRFQHGNYQLVEDLGKIEIIDKRTLEKIYPYVTVE